jgi:Tol biopolymer transport system component
MKIRNRKRDGLGLRVALTAVAAVYTWLLPASAAGDQESPEIEYTLTRVFGADSWSISAASLSPDGRWIAFTEGDDTTRKNIWIVSTEGGEPTALTTGPYLDSLPIWFPSGDRIAFLSTRTPIWAVMTLPLDRLTGRPTGPPRQVTLDRILANFDVSPDGKWIAYTSSGGLLKVLPAIGGIARTLAEGVLGPVWAPDGKSIYWATGGARSPKHTLMRVSVDGGRTETAFTWPGWISEMPGPNRSFVLRESMHDPGIEIATLAGHAVGRIVLPEGMSPMGISQDGHQLLGVRRDWAAPLTILPVEGGPARRLTEALSYDVPLGWSPDGEKILFETELNGKAVLLYAPVTGGPMPQVKLPDTRSRDFSPILSGDGNHLLYAVDDEGDELSTLRVYSIKENWSWEPSRKFTFIRGGQFAPTGAGGTSHRDGEDFLYYEIENGRYALYGSPPQGPSRLLRTFGERYPRSVAVHGRRIAWVENSGGVGSLFLATAGRAESNLILRREGMLDMAVWSEDGNKIAIYYFDPWRSSGDDFDPVGRDLLVLNVNSSGGIVGEPRSCSIPAGHWWSPRWLRDGRKILAVGLDGNVWLIPLEQGARPVAITQDDPNHVWSFELSPDGRYIAYPSSAQRGSSIWLLELEEPLINDY